MDIKVIRDLSGSMKHQVHVRQHTFMADVDEAGGGEDAGPSPHDLYDASLGACKALTVLWYAKRKGIPVEDVEVEIERDNTLEQKGTYRLKALLKLGGSLSDAQRNELLNVASKCPVHKLMMTVTTEIETVLT